MDSTSTYIAVLLVVHALVVARSLVDVASRRVPARTAWWFGVTFATLIPANVLLWLEASTTASVSDLAFALSLLPVILYPRALFGFACSVCPTPRWWSHAATISTVVLAAWLLLVLDEISIDGTRTPAVLALIAVESLQWLVLSVTSIVLLLRTSAGTPALVRARLRSIAVGIGLLGLANIVRSTEGGESLVPVWSALTGAGTLFAYVGYSPPATVRSRWSRVDRSELRRSIVGILEVERPELVGDVLLPAASRLVGGHGVALVGADGTIVAAAGITAAQAREALEQARSRPGFPEELVLVESMACIGVGGDVLVVAISPATPAFGREELELLLTVVSTANLAMARLQALERLQTREAQLVEAQRLSNLASWEWDTASASLCRDEQLDSLLGDHRAEVERAIAGAVEAKPADVAVEFDVDVDAGDGRAFHVRSIAAGESPHTDRLTGTIQDITDRVAAERTLRGAVEREREAADELRQLGRLKDGILVAVSHELRTPLTTILGLAATLRDRRDQLDEERQRELLDHVVAGSQRLERLLADLLDLNRLRSGKAIDREDTDVAELIRRTIADAESEQPPVELDLDDGVAAVDPIKVGRIVENLVGNAHKYARVPDPVLVRLRIGDTVQIAVMDRGPGVPPAEHRTIFEPFTRSSSTGAVPGTGVGLSLVAEFAQAHGGRAWVEDRPGGGASFWVELPVTDES